MDLSVTNGIQAGHHKGVNMSAIREAAKTLVANHGVDRYPTMPDKLVKLSEEVGELAAAWNKNKPIYELLKEIGDVVLTAQNIAEYWGHDVEELVLDVVEKDDRVFSEANVVPSKEK